MVDGKISPYEETDLAQWHHSGWRHGMETLSALLALCGENQPVTSGFPSPKACNEERWFFSLPEQAVEKSSYLDLRHRDDHVTSL